MNRNKLYWLIAVVALIVISVVAYLFCKFDIVSCISLEWVKAHSAALKASVMANYPRSVALYCLAYATIISFGISGVAPLTILGGYLFGVIGIIYALMGATAGCLTGFLIMRYVLGRTIRKYYAKQLEQFERLIQRYGASYLLMIHYSSVIPFFFINSFAALADVPVLMFIWTTILGSIPLLSIYVLAGRELGRIKTISGIFSPTIIALLVLLALLAVIPVLLKRSKMMREMEIK